MATRAKLLILGGTADGRQMCDLVHERWPDLALIYSVAGVTPAATVKQPKAPVTFIRGGFSQYGGLADYLLAHKISLVINATHPLCPIYD